MKNRLFLVSLIAVFLFFFSAGVILCEETSQAKEKDVVIEPKTQAPAVSNATPEVNAVLSEEPKKEDQKIIKVVEISGNKSISGSTVIAKIKIKPGDIFSQDILNDDLKRLYGLGYFTDVSIDVSDFESGLKIIFIVKEKPVVEAIVFKGNKAIKETLLKKEFKSNVEEMLDLSKLKSDIVDLKKLYEKKGYPLVGINYDIKLNEETNRATIEISIEEKSKVVVKSITFFGNKNFKARDLLKVMSTRAHWLWISGYFKEDILEADIDKLKAFYENSGFLDVLIEPDLKYNDTGSQLFITISIDEGKKYLIGNITISGTTIFPESGIRKSLKMKTGKPFSNEGLRIDIDNIQQYYYDRGYMSARINADISMDKENAKIDTTFSIVENELTYIDKIDVKGNIRTKDVVIRRELRVYPGEKFDGSKIRRSKERLYNLGYFEEVSFDTEPGSAPNRKNLLVNVKESKTGEFSFGGGYSSVDAFIGFAQVSQKNFDILNFPTFTGAGQRLDVRAEVSTVRQNYDISWTDPWIFGYPVELGFDAFNRSHDKKVGYAYNEAETGGDIRLGKNFTDYLRGDAIYKLELVNITDIDSGASQSFQDEAGKNTISSIVGSLGYDRRDNTYNPTSGYYLMNSIQNTGGFIGGSKNFYKYIAAGEYYQTFFQKIVLQLKAQGGFANKYSGSDAVPVYERFFAGGQYTIRGYKERSVGPQDSLTGEYIGGNSMALGNAEVTFPLYQNMLKGAVFFDAGDVWANASNFFSTSLKYGTGAGLRIKTPIGPVSLDLGFPLSNIEGQKKKPQFYFSVSRGF